MRVETPLFLSDKQIAARYGLSRNSVWRLVKTGQLPEPIKLFKSTTRWKLSEIEAFEARAALQKTVDAQVISASKASAAARSSIKAATPDQDDEL